VVSKNVFGFPKGPPVPELWRVKVGEKIVFLQKCYRLSGSKVTAFFPKAFLQKYYFFTNFDPSQFRNRGAFWETKNIFGNHYPITLKNAQKTRIVQQFF
jgi:hypothetical protein